MSKDKLIQKYKAKIESLDISIEKLDAMIETTPSGDDLGYLHDEKRAVKKERRTFKRFITDIMEL